MHTVLRFHSRVDRKELISSRIITLKKTSLSPNMNQIELMWSNQKDEFATDQFTGSSMETVKQA